MIRETTIPATECRCEVCGHEWTQTDGKIPTHCRKCRSREWNGKKQFVQSHVHEIKLPAPRNISETKNKARNTALFDDEEI
jgi:hypothetical protein